MVVLTVNPPAVVAIHSPVSNLLFCCPLSRTSLANPAIVEAPKLYQNAFFLFLVTEYTTA